MIQTERALTFGCGGDNLPAVLHVGNAGTDWGVLIVVGGPQYRAGSHRQFVLLARALAAAGFPTLRFDVRGMGDGSGALRDFEHIDEDIGAALDAFSTAQPGLRRFVLWGLCDGASAALLYLDRRPDMRVAGLALANPWVRSEATLARTHIKHYYRQRLMQREFWLKLIGGQVAKAALTGLLHNLRTAFARGPQAAESAGVPYQASMARAWATFAGPRLLLLSENDYTAREFVEFSSAEAAWQRALRERPPSRVQLEGADHTCSQPGAQRMLEAATVRWLCELA